MSKTLALTLITILSTGAILASGTTLAQPAEATQGFPCPRAQGMWPGGGNTTGAAAPSQLDRMAWRLNLTPEQQAKLEPILRQRDELRAAQRQAMRNEIAAILTPEQLALFDQMGPGRGGRMGRGMGPGGGPGWGNPAPAGQP